VIRRHPFLSIVAGAYVVSLAWITLTPAPFGGARSALMAKVATALANFPPTDWITADGLEFACNIVLFIPFGALFLALFGRRRWLGIMFAGFIASCWIELAQSVWLPMRESDPIFVIAHVAGTVLGVSIVVAASRRETARRPIEVAPVSNH
jgi:glycopeptide antibiotics resistance protein